MNSLNILKEHLDIINGVSLISAPILIVFILIISAAANNVLKLRGKKDNELIILREKISLFIILYIAIISVTCGIIILNYCQR